MSSAAISDDSPIDPDDELLVSYLDGELDRAAQSTLENRLLEEETLRQRLQQLQTGWDLLEELPDAAPNLKLVESTLELVVSEIVSQAPPTKSVWSRFRFPIALATLCLTGVLSAYGIVASMKRSEYQQELQDLAIVEHLDAYRYGNDLELMRQLAVNQSWMRMAEAIREVSDQEQPINVASVSLDQREELVESLSLEQRAQLNSRWERFIRLAPEVKDQIRQTARAVSEQPNPASLLSTMATFAQWRENLQDELRDRIMSQDPDVRRIAINEAVEKTQQQIAKQSGVMLDDQTIEWIMIALRQIVRQRIERGDQATIAAEQMSHRFPDPEFGVIVMIVNPKFRGRRMPMRGGEGERPDPLQVDELEMIQWVLPKEAAEFFEAMTDNYPPIQALTLQEWAEAAVHRQFKAFRGEEPSLLDRYKERKLEGDGEHLDLLPAKEILKQLSGGRGR